MIVLKYKNGSHFIINENKAFFTDSKTGERLQSEHLKSKLLDIASDKSKFSELFHAYLVIGGEKLVEYGPISYNEPLPSPNDNQRVINHLRKLKDLKKETRHFHFTYRIKWGTEGVSFSEINQAA